MDMKDKTKWVHCLVSIPMASIMKRGDSYSVRYKYKDHSGKPCEGWESFKTKKEAQERKITVEKELLDGTFLIPDTMTVEEMLYKWIPIQSTKHKWSPKTYTQSVAMVQNLIVPYIGKRKVQELRTYDIEKFYATLAKTPCGQYVHGVKQTLTDKQKKRLLSSTSIHEVHTLLKTAFSYAVEWDLIHKIPLPRDAPQGQHRGTHHLGRENHAGSLADHREPCPAFGGAHEHDPFAP